MTRLSAMASSIASGLSVGIRTVQMRTAMVFARVRGWSVLLARTMVDYSTEIGDPATNSIVGAVVGWVARNFPEAPVKVIRMDSVSHESIPMGLTGAGAFLKLLERPNPHYSGVLQWMATIVDYICAGDAYWIKVRSDMGPGRVGRVIALWWVPASYMEPRWPEGDTTVFIDHYDMKIDSDIYQVDPMNVVHFRNGVNPKNTRKGISRLESLNREIFIDNEAAAFTASILRNLGVPGVTISPAQGSGPLKGDPEEIKSRFIERTTGDQRGVPMVFTVPTEVKQLSFSPQAMDLKSLRRIPEERVAAVLGVPAGVAQLGAGLDRSTFTNYSEANRAAYTQCIIPLGRHIAADLEMQLLTDFVDLDVEMLDVIFDYTLTEAMAEAAASIWARHESASTKGLITRAEFKRATGHQVAREDDVYIIPQNYMLVPSKPDQPPELLAVNKTNAPAVPRNELAMVGTEARCPECDKLLGVDVSGTIWCPRCKAGRVFGQIAA